MHFIKSISFEEAKEYLENPDTIPHNGKWYTLDPVSCRFIGIRSDDGVADYYEFWNIPNLQCWLRAPVSSLQEFNEHHAAISRLGYIL